MSYSPESVSPESVRNTSVGDQATGLDSLGFRPYVIAIAEFLLNPETKPPLTLSIEGEWGSGKSSFMKQLDEYLRKKGQRTVWFNAWRHDKAEAVWAAFALSFIKQISTPQGYKDLPRAIKGYGKLQYLRFNREKGLFEAIKALPLILFVICAAIAIPIILANDGVKGINELVRVTTSQDDLWKQIGAAFKLLFAVGGLTLSGTGVIAGIRSLFGNFQKLLISPKNNLIKYLEAPDYKKQSAFIEEFHEDFSKIVDAYIGDGKVFVFIDDLDRCEHSKSADLMQAINLMIADDPSVVFILGMDREKVAASLAVKYENILRYLPSENSDIDADILERYSTNKGLAYGYTFIEKFVQIPFQIPQPSQADFENFLQQLAIPQSPEKEPTPQKYNFSLSKFPVSHLFNKKRSQTNISNTLKSSQVQPIETDNIMLSKPTENQVQESKTLATKRSETILFKFDQDSKRVRDVVMMVAPTLDYNPRRIKQFLNLFRLKLSIADSTGLFDRIEDSDGNATQEPLTFEQLGKFVAISLKWPLFLLELENDPQLFKNFYNNKYNLNIGGIDKSTFHSTSRIWGDESFRYWLSQDKFRKLLAYGHQEYDQTSQAYTIDLKFSLAEVNVEKLLQVSPKVVRSNPNLDQQTQTAQVEITSLPTDFYPEMVDIPAGKFMMGSDEYDNEKPIHEVTVQAFKIGKYPVTQAQYEAVMGTNPNIYFLDNRQNPVEQVSWFDSQAFCEKLSELKGEKYRLPTEAEWEYACRAGTKTRYYFGDDQSQLGDYAWFEGNSNSQTHPVGEKRANLFGLYDMHGNVWEWCKDEWHENYQIILTDESSLNQNTSQRSLGVLRGGSWNNFERNCRSTHRYRYLANNRNYNIGFRVVVSSP